MLHLKSKTHRQNSLTKERNFPILTMQTKFLRYMKDILTLNDVSLEAITAQTENGETNQNIAIGTITVGPIIAQLLITPNNKVLLRSSFVDEEKAEIYNGLEEIIANVPSTLVQIKNEHPVRFRYDRLWYNFLRSMWKIVLDKDYFYGW